MFSKMLLATSFLTPQAITAATANEYCEIYLVRHGETDWNVQGKLMGSSDIPLNETGEKQAHKVKEKLNSVDFAAAFSSDKRRAHRTAEIILAQKNIPITQTPALRECSFGSWEGQAINDFKVWAKTQPQRNSMSQTKCLAHKWDDDIESLGEIYTRVTNFINTIAPQHMGGTILCCAHSGVLRAILCNLNFKPGLSWYIANCAMLTLRIDRQGALTLTSHEGCQSMNEPY